MSSSKLKTKAITVRITFEEWIKIKDIVKKENLSVNDFVRKALNLPILNQDEIKKQRTNWNKPNS